MIDSDLLLEAYRLGVFPMAMENGEIRWFSPEPRTILPLDSFHVPHGLKRERRARAIEIRINTSFEAVLRACAERADTWINDEIVESYARLHELGHAHSVEAWEGNELVGGLYGVSLGSAFFGESMFSRRTDASKICLVHLVERLRQRGFTLLDTQFTTEHLKTFGAIDVPKDDYAKMLEKAMESPNLSF